MKQKLQAIVSAPILIGIGWLFTKLSENYGEALDDIEFDFE